MTQRLNLNLTDASYSELRRLAERIGQSLSQTVRTALTHYDGLVTVAERGNELVERSGPRDVLGVFPIEPDVGLLEGAPQFPSRHPFQ